MSTLKNVLLGLTMVLGLGTAAFAEGGVEPWDLKERNVYVVDMQGNMRVHTVDPKIMASMRSKAKAVPRGTIFFMSNGQLYMMQDRKMFDRAGSFNASGV